jgi:hypothetical protein
MAEYTILEQVKIRLKQFHIEEVTGDNGNSSDVVVFDDKEENPFIEQLIKEATDEVIGIRNYPDSYSEEQINDDLKKFERTIVDLVVYDHSQAGESYMASYSENGVSRNWVDRNKLLKDIYPFVSVIC